MAVDPRKTQMSLITSPRLNAGGTREFPWEGSSGAVNQGRGGALLINPFTLARIGAGADASIFRESFRHVCFVSQGTYREDTVMRQRIITGFVLSLILLTTYVWGQSGTLPRSSVDVLPPGKDRSETAREDELAGQLQRLKDAVGGMGPNHPQLAKSQQRIRDLESDLAALRTVPNPFNELEQKGVKPQDIVERLNERELRTLVVRLAVDLKDLRQRVLELEQANPRRF